MCCRVSPRSNCWENSTTCRASPAAAISPRGSEPGWRGKKIRQRRQGAGESADAAQSARARAGARRQFTGIQQLSDAAPGAFFGRTWAAAGIIARNLLLNWLVLVPLLAAVTGIPLLFRLIVHGTGIPESWHWQLLFAALGIELLASLSVYSFRRFAKRPGIPQACFIFGCVLPICLAAGVLCTAALGLNLPWHNSPPHPCCSDLTGLWKFSFPWCLAVPCSGWLVAEILARLFPRWTLPAPDATPEQVRQARLDVRIAGLADIGIGGHGALGAGGPILLHSFLFNHPDAYVILALPILLGIYLIARALFVGVRVWATRSGSEARTTMPTASGGHGCRAGYCWS